MLVVDASVAVKFMVREPGSDAAERILETSDPLIAPDWLLVEAANTLWKKVKLSELLEIHAQRHLDTLPDFFARLYASVDLVSEALRLGFRLRHSVYDCLYLALAIREQARLVTADDKFLVRARAAGFGEYLEAL